nr:hypothetical protein [uncultured Rhodoferax sp.]
MVYSFLRRSTTIALLTTALLPLGATAQLSSPIAGGLATGTGAGVHSPNSPIAPLQARADVLAWSLLTDVKSKVEKNRMLPIFPPQVQALHRKVQRVQGFMMPLDAGKTQTHFLLSAVPLTCSFCLPGGPESLVEVRTKTTIKYSSEPVVVEGQFSVLKDDPDGVYYRIADAIAVQ